MSKSKLIENVIWKYLLDILNVSPSYTRILTQILGIVKNGKFKPKPILAKIFETGNHKKSKIKSAMWGSKELCLSNKFQLVVHILRAMCIGVDDSYDTSSGHISCTILVWLR